MHIRKILPAVLFSILSAGALAAALFEIYRDDAALFWFVLFPMAGLFAYLACMTAGIQTWWGLGADALLLFVFLPFPFRMQRWWLDGGGIVFYFGVFFALLLGAGWLIGYLPVQIAAKETGETKKARAGRRIRLTILLVLLLIVLFSLWNLVFGNPVTAMIAGNDMRDWIAEQAENGVVYEIMGRHLPRYDWYGTQYLFDLAGEGSRWVLHWNEGKIRIDHGNW